MVALGSHFPSLGLSFLICRMRSLIAWSLWVSRADVSVRVWGGAAILPRLSHTLLPPHPHTCHCCSLTLKDRCRGRLCYNCRLPSTVWTLHTKPPLTLLTGRGGGDLPPESSQAPSDMEALEVGWSPLGSRADTPLLEGLWLEGPLSGLQACSRAPCSGRPLRSGPAGAGQSLPELLGVGPPQLCCLDLG